MLITGRPSTLDALAAFAIAGVIAWLLVPLAERLAVRVGAIDYPNERSLHEIPTPKLGGLAILVGALVAGTLFLPNVALTHALLIGAAVIALVGAIDDVVDLPAGLKLLGQVIAAMIPVFNGVAVGAFNLPYIGGLRLNTVVLVHSAPVLGEVTLGHVLTIVGLVAVMNVINLIDGVDGLAAGVCLISSVSLSVIALSLNRPGAGVLAALIAGASLGFLRHGFPPATSFLGDTGSNLLGYLLGAVAIEGALKTNAVVALFFPLIVLTVPIFDTGFVVAKRIKYRRPIYRADTSHIHHRLARIGFSQRRTLLYLYAWAAIMAGLALALRFVPYTDNHGNFNVGWTAVMVACALVAAAASVYLVIVLEILKLRRFRLRQLVGLRGPMAVQDVDSGVARELETGSFEVVNPQTGEFEALDPETGEFEAIPKP